MSRPHDAVIARKPNPGLFLEDLNEIIPKDQLYTLWVSGNPDRALMVSHSKRPTDDLIAILKSRLGGRIDTFLIPPPVFTEMGGEFIGFDQDEGWLRTRFPVKPEYLNPYRTMQGGMIAAAVDNTLGPLSMLVASPNVTRRLEMKFSRPVRADMHHILVLARFIGRENQELRFTAEVRSEDGLLLARARATHWISRED